MKKFEKQLYFFWKALDLNTKKTCTLNESNNVDHMYFFIHLKPSFVLLSIIQTTLEISIKFKECVQKRAILKTKTKTTQNQNRKTKQKLIYKHHLR